MTPPSSTFFALKIAVNCCKYASYDKNSPKEGTMCVFGAIFRRREGTLLNALWWYIWIIKKAAEKDCLNRVTKSACGSTQVFYLSPLNEGDFYYLPTCKDVPAGILGVHTGSTDPNEEVSMHSSKVRHVIACAIEFSDTAFIPSVEAGDGINGNERNAPGDNRLHYRCFFSRSSLGLLSVIARLNRRRINSR